MSKTKIYSRYDVPPQVKVKLQEGSNVDKESHIFCDINYIIERYRASDGQSGLPVRSNYNKPIYGDFSKSYTLADVFALKDNMSYLYDELPDDVRKQFKNYNDFLKQVGSADEESLATLFSDKRIVAQTNQQSEPKDTAGSLEPVESRGSVSLSSDVKNISQ